MRKKRRLLITSGVITLALAFVLTTLPTYTHTFWAGSLSDSNADDDAFIGIGEWEYDDGGGTEPPDYGDDLDNVVAILKANDPLLFLTSETVPSNLADSASTLYVIGIDDKASGPVTVKPYDVFIYVSEGAIQAVQATKELTFASWDALKAALINRGAGLNSTGDQRDNKNIYTKIHAPIQSGGKSWLARHNNVTSTPALGTDWFQKSDTWLAQSYPSGSFIAYTNPNTAITSYYRSNATTGAGDVPGTSGLWTQLSEYQQQTIPNWVNNDAYTQNDIVRYNNEIYIATQNVGTGILPTQAPWQLATLFSGIGVPQYQGNTNYYAKSFVYQPNGQNPGYYVVDALRNPAQAAQGEPPNNGNPNSGWQPVIDFASINGVAEFEPRPYMMPAVIKHNGVIYELVQDMPHYQGDREPGIGNSSAQFWRTVNMWADSFLPGPILAGFQKPTNTFYFYNGGFYITIAGEAQPSATDPNDLRNFRAVNEYNPTTRYYHNGANNFRDDQNLRQYSSACFVIEEDGSRSFYYRQNGAGIYDDYVVDIDPREHPNHWQKKEFYNTDNMTVTVLNGQETLWVRNPIYAAVPFTNTQSPSMLSDYWTRYVRDTDAPYVYVRDVNNANITLWRRTSVGPTSSRPGEADWEQVIYPTGYNYVRTEGNDEIRVWYSATQSSLVPGLNVGDWQLMNAPTGNIDFASYVINAGNVIYYQMINGHPSVVNNAWIGPGDIMNYHYDAHTTYASGDVVVFGVTATNMYRYFRYIGAAPSMGVEPMSSAGNTIWLPFR